jgi:hypothetical protein
VFRQRIGSMGVEQVIIAARCPGQNPYAKQIIGSIRRECLDHVIVFNEAHLLRALGEYSHSYHLQHDHLERAHQGLGNRLIEGMPEPASGRVVRRERLGGLLNHHHREAA